MRVKLGQADVLAHHGEHLLALTGQLLKALLVSNQVRNEWGDQEWSSLILHKVS